MGKIKMTERQSDRDLLIEIGERLCELANPSDPNDPISELLGLVEDHTGKNLEQNGCGSKRHLLTGGKK
jgi:hypothetical protein